MAVAGRNGRDGTRAESSFERQQAWGLTKKIQHPLFSPFYRSTTFYQHKDAIVGSILHRRSISVDNVITTFRRPKELSGTTIGPRVTNDAKSLRFSPGARSRENTSAESNKVFLERRMRGDDTFVECRNKSAYRLICRVAKVHLSFTVPTFIPLIMINLILHALSFSLSLALPFSRSTISSWRKPP